MTPMPALVFGLFVYHITRCFVISKSRVREQRGLGARAAQPARAKCYFVEDKSEGETKGHFASY